MGWDEVGVKRDQPHSSTVSGAPAISATPPRWRPRFPAGIGILLGLSCVIFAGFWLLDAAYFGRRTPAAEHLSAWRLLVDLDPETLQNALGSLAQVEFLKLEKPPQGGRVLIRRALAAGFDAPVEAQSFAVEKSEGGVGVSNIDDEKHAPRG